MNIVIFISIMGVVCAVLPVQIATRLVYGKLLNDGCAYSLILRYLKNTEYLNLNGYDRKIIHIEGHPYIYKHWSWLSRYHIEGVGTIPRFGKAEKLVKRIYIELNSRP